MFLDADFWAFWRLVARIGGVGALSPIRVPGYAMRTYSGRPSSSIRFSTSAAIATSVACRPSVCERSPSPMTRFQREISASTRARQPYPDALCQPMRPRSAMHRRWRSRCVGAVSAVSLGTAFARGGTTTAASGWPTPRPRTASSRQRPRRERGNETVAEIGISYNVSG
jgi:hypothetical protein